MQINFWENVIFLVPHTENKNRKKKKEEEEEEKKKKKKKKKKTLIAETASRYSN